MSTPKKPSSPLNDEDMHALFSNEDVDVPAELDNSVLTAARDAMNSDQSKLATANNELDAAPLSWRPSWTKGLATAAVVVLGIVIVPRMISSPQTSPQSSLELSEAEMSISAADVAPSIAAPAPVATESEAESVTDNAEAAQSLSVNSSSRSAELQRKAAGSSLADVAEVPAYRESPEAWVMEISRLYKNQELEQSQKEYALFKRRYPNHKLMSELPKELRE